MAAIYMCLERQSQTSVSSVPVLLHEFLPGLGLHAPVMGLCITYFLVGFGAQVKALICDDAALLEKYERSLVESYVEVQCGLFTLTDFYQTLVDRGTSGTQH